MPARVTGEEVLRWALRLCNQKALWQHGGPQMLRRCKSVKNRSDTLLSQVWRAGQTQRPLAGLSVSIVRYYSQGKVYHQDLEGKEERSIRTLEPAFAPEIGSVQAAPDQALKKRVPFYYKLTQCSSPTDVLDLAAEYTSNHRRVSNCLTRIWAIAKRMPEEQRYHELQLMREHAGFEELLQMTMKEAGRMRSEDVAYSLLAIVKLGVSQRSRVIQTLLRVSQENLNGFDERSLSLLASSLEYMESSANVDALKEGVRLMIAAQLPRIQNVMALQTLMRHLGKDAHPDLKRKLERKALSMIDQFSLPNYQYMISTLATMGFNSKPLLEVCSKNIAENVHGIPFNRQLTVLRACGELNYRDLAMFTAISEYMASAMVMWNNKQVILALFEFDNLAFCPKALLDAFAERVIQNPDTLALKDLLSILKIMAVLNHDLQDRRQQFLDCVTQVLQSHHSKMPAPLLLKAVYSLCLLGHFPSATLEQLLQSQTLEELSAIDGRSQKGLEKKLRIVDLCLRLDRPLLAHPMTVPSSSLGSPAPIQASVNPGLSETLQSLMVGGLLQEGVVVEDIYFIDGLITRPLQATEGSVVSEGESPPSEHSQRIAVLCALPSSFCYGTSHPRGNLAMKMRHLKALGYSPVLVKEQELNSMSAEERTEVLRALIFPEQERSNIEHRPE